MRAEPPFSSASLALACGALLAACSAETSVDAGYVDAGYVDAAAACRGSLVVLGPQPGWLGAPRDVLPVRIGGRETLTVLASPDGGVVEVVGTSSDPTVLEAENDGGVVVLHAVGVATDPVQIRLDTDGGCTSIDVAVGQLVGGGPPEWEYRLSHSCADDGPGFGLGHDAGVTPHYLAGGHAHVCFSMGAMNVRGDVIDQDLDLCGSSAGCRQLNFDLADSDTGPSGVSTVDLVTGPPPLDLAVGASVTACFQAWIAATSGGGVILDDGWTYAGPAFVEVTIAHTDFAAVADCAVVHGVAAGTGLLTATLAGVSTSVVVTVH